MDVIRLLALRDTPLDVAEVLAAVEENRPTRVFVDSLTQLRFLSADVYQYRKQVLSFLRYLSGCGATVIFSSEHSTELPDDDLQFMSDGVINLESTAAGATVRVSKFRGSDFIRGPHQMRVRNGGVVVYARSLPPPRKQERDERRQWSCGVKAIDAMLNGGIEAGTISLITGPSGVGKSTLASLFVAEAARQERRAVVYLFEEEMQTFHRRCKALGIGMEKAFRDDKVSLEQVEPMRYMADEFAMKVRRQVENEDVELVVIDSTAGFELTLEGEDIRKRLHTMAKTLSRLGVTVILVNEVESLMGEFKVSEKGISYLADNVIFLRYVEAGGELRKAIGVLKKRLSDFDPRLHMYRIGGDAPISVESGIEGLSGVMTSGPATQEE
ncbi:MAG: AAA family ATPase [Proteobacteria bacterium]|nr:AAA family ATPase [Pseudomonadota bacterium]